MYQRILVPVDGSATSRRGLQEAIGLAKAMKSRLRLVHVVDELPPALGDPSYGVVSADISRALKAGGEAILQDAQAAMAGTGVPFDTMLLETFGGRVSDQVIRHAQEWKPDLIVIGTHGRRGVGRALLGSDAEQILRMAPVPVLMVRAQADSGD